MIVYAFTPSGERVINMGQQAPKGNVAYADYATEAMRLIDGGQTVQQAVDHIAAKFGVFLAIIEPPDPGFTLDFEEGATDKDNTLTVNGGANGSLTFGWDYVTLPPEPTDAQLGAILFTLAAAQEQAERADRLRQLESLLASQSVMDGYTPRTDIVTAGQDWYDDPESVSEELGSAFSAAQAAGLIP